MYFIPALTPFTIGVGFLSSVGLIVVIRKVISDITACLKKKMTAVTKDTEPADTKKIVQELRKPAATPEAFVPDIVGSSSHILLSLKRAKSTPAAEKILPASQVRALQTSLQHLVDSFDEQARVDEKNCHYFLHAKKLFSICLSINKTISMKEEPYSYNSYKEELEAGKTAMEYLNTLKTQLPEGEKWAAHMRIQIRELKSHYINYFKCQNNIVTQSKAATARLRK